MAISPGVLFYDPRAKPLSTAGQFQPGCYYCFLTTLTTTPTNVYADAALTTPLTQPAPGAVNPVGFGTVAASDGRLVPIYLDPATTYRVQLYSAAGVVLEDTDPYSPGIFTAGQIAAAQYFGDTGALNALSISGTGITAYKVGLTFEVKVANTSTIANPTLNVNGLGAKTIVNQSGASLIGGQLVAGGIYFFGYDGVNFQILSPPAVPPVQLVTSVGVSVINSTTLTNSDLLLPVVAGTYEVEITLQLNTTATGTNPGFKGLLSSTGGEGNATRTKGFTIENAAVTSGAAFNISDWSTTFTMATLVSSGGSADFVWVKRIITISAPGNLVVQFAQNTLSTGAAAAILAGSYMKITKVA